MKSLITSLDNEFNKNPVSKETFVRAKEMQTYTDSVYDLYFTKDYEKKFEEYNDLDKCNEGFKRKRPKVLAKPKKKHIEVNVIFLICKS